MAAPRRDPAQGRQPDAAAGGAHDRARSSPARWCSCSSRQARRPDARQRPGLHLRVRAGGRPPARRGRPPALDGCQALNPEHAACPVALITSQFLHADWLHLIFNMLFLWVLRQQHRGSPRADPLPVPALLPPLRGPGRGRPGGRGPRQPGAADRRVGGHLGGPRRVPRALSARRRVDRRLRRSSSSPSSSRPGSGWRSTSPCSSCSWATRGAAAASPTWPTSAASRRRAVLIKPFLLGRDDPPPPAPAVGPVTDEPLPAAPPPAARARRVGEGRLRPPPARGGDAGRHAGRAGHPGPRAGARPSTCRTCSPAGRASCSSRPTARSRRAPCSTPWSRSPPPRTATRATPGPGAR